MFQMKLSEEFHSLQATVSQLNIKLERCNRILEAREREPAEKECQAVEYCNALEVLFYFCIYTVRKCDDKVMFCHSYF